jgi:large subunit ribosomal protein L24
MKLKKGDEIKVTTGKDAGKTGKIQKVFTKEKKVLIEGINQFKRHVKARMPGQKSEIISITKPVPAANVALICPKCKQPTRVAYKLLKEGKVRVCAKCDQEFA